MKEDFVFIETLNRQEVFSFLRPEQVDTLSDAAEVIRFEAGDEVYTKDQAADSFYVVLKGAVALRLPGKNGVSILIDELAEGAMFGSCICLALDAYICTAQCTKDSELLRIRTVALKELLDDDPRMGYAIQSRISQIYFKRYMETMKKLQAIVMNIPLETEP
jgi:CRP-like cAMP-binding protein